MSPPPLSPSKKKKGNKQQQVKIFKIVKSPKQKATKNNLLKTYNLSMVNAQLSDLCMIN